MGHVLYVEDNPADAEVVREALAECDGGHKLAIVTDGEQALAFVRKVGPFAGAERPDLILLDLNLPKIDGRQVLKELKADPEFAGIPIVVLTSSSADTDVQRAYDSHANAYVRKNVDLDRFMEAIKAIEAFWLQVARLP